MASRMYRRWSWCSFLVAAFLTVVGFGANPVLAAKITLKVSLWGDSLTPETKAVFAEYEKLNPDVKIEPLIYPWGEYHDKLLTMVAGKVAPDVMVLSRTYLPAFAEQKLVRPLDDWLNRDYNVRTDIVEMLSGTYKGRMYGIPIWGGPSIMMYNADMFEEAGQVDPGKLAYINSWTWDKVIEMGKKITQDMNGDGQADQTMLPCVHFGWRAQWLHKIWAYGGDMVDLVRNLVLVDKPESIKGLQLWVDMDRVHHITSRPANGNAWEPFATGNQALADAWLTTAVNTARVGTGFRVDIVTSPAGPKGSYHLAGGCPVCVSASTSHPEEAYKFATWYAMESKQWVEGGLPPAVKVLKNEYMTYLGRYFKNPWVVIAAMSSVKPDPEVSLHGLELSDAWYPILKEVAYGTISVQEGVERMAAATKRILGIR